MRKYVLLGVCIFLLISFHILIGYGTREVGANETKVAILPFQLNASEDIAYLSQAVRDMLTSRISLGTQMVVAEQSSVKEVLAKKPYSGNYTKKEAQEIGAVLGVGYVIFGSITKIGSSISIDMNVLNIAQKTTHAVFTQSMGLDEVIPRMNTLAQEIKDIISYGLGSSRTETPVAQPATIDNMLLEKGAKDEELFPRRVEESDLPEAKSESKILMAPATPVSSGEKERDEPLTGTEAESVEKQETQPGEKKKFEATSENPVYQKTLEELEKSPKAKSEGDSE